MLRRLDPSSVPVMAWRSPLSALVAWFGMVVVLGTYFIYFTAFLRSHSVAPCAVLPPKNVFIVERHLAPGVIGNKALLFILILITESLTRGLLTVHIVVFCQ